MKKLLSILFIFSGLLPASAQQPLSLAAVRDRLLPEYKTLTAMPIEPTTYSGVLAARKKEPQNPPALKNADSIDFRDLKIPGLLKNDPNVLVRVYIPKHIKNPPVFLWFHGGGFVLGNINQDHQTCADLALYGRALVISVSYRLAPENPYPAAVNDAYASLLWAKAHAAEFGADPTKIGVGGGSAGAGISGGLALMARDKKGPKLLLQALLIPPGDGDTTRVSVREYYQIPGVKGADIPVLLSMYMGKDFKGPIPGYALPGMAQELKGLPTTYIVTNGVDPLRDGGLAYAIRLIEAGIPVELHNFPGVPHGLGPKRFAPEFYAVLRQYLQ
eukprot:gene10548-12271_t